MKNRALDDGGPRRPSAALDDRVQEVSCGTAVSKLDYCQTYQQVLSEVKISCSSPKGQGEADENSVLGHRGKKLQLLRSCSP